MNTETAVGLVVFVIVFVALAVLILRAGGKR